MVESVINMDWFECMLTGNISADLDFPESIKIEGLNCRLHKKSYGTTHFSIIYDIIMDGREFGTVLASPRKGNKLPPDFIQFQAKNHVLYEVGFVLQLHNLITHAGWKFRNPIRIDIAIDGGNFMQLMADTITGALHRVGHQLSNVHFDANMKITGFDIGKRDSTKWATCYYKRTELAKSYKNYISDYWKRSELADQENPERLELKLRKDACLAIDGFDWRELENSSYLASCMRTQLGKMWQFTDPDENPNVSRRKKFDDILWDELGGQLLPKLSAIPPGEEWKCKMMCKGLFQIHLVTGQMIYRQMALEVASIIQHIGWFRENQSRWETELKGRLGDPRKADTIYKHLSRFVTYDQNEQLTLLKENPTSFMELGAVAGSQWFSQ